MRYIVWDFDGTLGWRQGGWAAAMVDALAAAASPAALTVEVLRPHIQTGFPWHHPEVVHTDVTTADQWWDRLEPVFHRAFIAAGVGVSSAADAAVRVRAHFLEPEHWRLFGDVIATLDALDTRGWSHVILSNHAPELHRIVDILGIGARFGGVFSSADLGYEKPHPRTYEAVREWIGNHPTIMVGDNPVADVEGPGEVGIPAFLVRREPPPGSASEFHPGLADLAQALRRFDAN
ncbi:MAG: HAD family hydrolase [Candidatus Latescibacterota bacterium]|nr:HAD family hydrolase [Candidatus Latescibacterota bacterium]